MFNPRLIQLETKHNNINKDRIAIMIGSIIIVGILLLVSLNK